MKQSTHPTRRRVLQGLAASGVAASQLVPSFAFAQAFPSKPLRVIVPWAPGGLVDTGGRVVADALSRALGQPASVENIPGAAGAIGAEAVVKAPPDGHTLLMATSSLAIDAGGSRKINFDPVRDLTPVALVADTQNVVIVPAASSIQNIAQLVAAAKQAPGNLSYGTPGIGSPAHLFVEYFAQTAGIQLLHVPYGRTQAINDLIGGRLGLMFATIPAALPALKGGQVRALAVTGAKRSQALPDLPTIAESGVPGYAASQWLGVFAPAGTPKDTVQKLHAEVARAVLTANVAQTLVSRGLEPHAGSPEELAAAMAGDVRKWGDVIRRANIKLE